MLLQVVIDRLFITYIFVCVFFYILKNFLNVLNVLHFRKQQQKMSLSFLHPTEVLLFATVALHVFLAPGTKVEVRDFYCNIASNLGKFQHTSYS